MSQPYEIRASNYPHPEHQHGQHTNGPASLFIRRLGGPWYLVLTTRQPHVVRTWMAKTDWNSFVTFHCKQLDSQKPTT